MPLASRRSLEPGSVIEVWSSAMELYLTSRPLHFDPVGHNEPRTELDHQLINHEFCDGRNRPFLDIRCWREVAPLSCLCSA
jgi:hypothetical protein